MVFLLFLSLRESLSIRTSKATYELFKPNHSEQRLPPLYYRGCWHNVSRDLYPILPSFSSDRTGLYSTKAFLWDHPRGLAGSDFRPLSNIPHCCLKKSLDRVSVPVWRIILSNPLRIIGLVSFYLTNYLILFRLI